MRRHCSATTRYFILTQGIAMSLPEQAGAYRKHSPDAAQQNPGNVVSIQNAPDCISIYSIRARLAVHFQPACRDAVAGRYDCIPFVQLTRRTRNTSDIPAVTMKSRQPAISRNMMPA